MRRIQLSTCTISTWWIENGLERIGLDWIGGEGNQDPWCKRERDGSLLFLDLLACSTGGETAVTNLRISQEKIGKSGLPGFPFRPLFSSTSSPGGRERACGKRLLISSTWSRCLSQLLSIPLSPKLDSHSFIPLPRFYPSLGIHNSKLFHFHLHSHFK